MRFARIARLIAAAAVVGSLQLPQAEAASPVMLKLLKVLKDRGSITAQEYDELLAAAAAESAAAPAVATTTTTTTTTSSAATTATAPAATPAGGTAAKDAKAAGSGKSDSKGEPLTADSLAKTLKGKWYEKMGFRGYTQLRYHSILDQDGPELNVPNDRSISENNTFYLRRVRLILSGDISEHLSLYLQPDLNGSPTSGDFSVQLRDAYGDVSFDKDKEYRVRLGQSKVPFGWSNMQSSSNRGPLERPDAINSAAEGERDIGAFFYWAPADVRKRFADLVKLGLKGSGDYGVVGVGIYSGQGLNRLDLNGDPHVIGRVSYPFQFANGQYFEAGIQGYTGRFVTSTTSITSGGSTFTPSVRSDGLSDERVGVSATWYPQPFGIEAEWNVGRGPTLSDDLRRITSESLHGGYVQVSYKDENKLGNWFPFARWQYYRGGRKFATNAPDSTVQELDFGIEWAPWTSVEFTVQYTHTFERTNTRIAPYLETTGADRISFQAQLNY